MVSRADQYLDFVIINLNNTVLHNYVVQMSEERLGPFKQLLEILSRSQAKIYLRILFKIKLAMFEVKQRIKIKRSSNLVRAEK